MSGAFWRADAEGISVTVKVTPRARKPGLRGVVPGANGARLAIAVTAAPEAGAANRAACAALAAALGVPPSAVRVVAGATAREKRLAVAGDPATLAARAGAL
ncbi:MAG: DUF167 family protein [Acetobacteraceae bacterium]